MNPIQPKTSRGANAAFGLEVAYYTLAATALVVGTLGAHGILGTSFQGFMHHTLNSLAQNSWVAIGAGTLVAPQLLKLAAKAGKATKGFVDRKRGERMFADMKAQVKREANGKRSLEACRAAADDLKARFSKA